MPSFSLYFGLFGDDGYVEGGEMSRMMQSAVEIRAVNCGSSVRVLLRKNQKQDAMTTTQFLRQRVGWFRDVRNTINTLLTACKNRQYESSCGQREHVRKHGAPFSHYRCGTDEV